MFPLSKSMIQMFRFLSALCLLLAANLTFAGSYERKDVMFSSQGLKAAIEPISPARSHPQIRPKPGTV